MAGYRIAVKEAVKYIKENLVVKGDDIGFNNLINAGAFFYSMFECVLAQFFTPLTFSCFLTFHMLTHSTNSCIHSENFNVLENHRSRIRLLFQVGSRSRDESPLRKGWAF